MKNTNNSQPLQVVEVKTREAVVTRLFLAVTFIVAASTIIGSMMAGLVLSSSNIGNVTNTRNSTKVMTQKSVAYIGDGDLNGDKAVTVADAELALQMAVGLVSITPEAIAHGDVAPYCDQNRDNTIDTADAVVINRAAMGELELPCDYYGDGDVDGDKKLTQNDAELTLRMAIGLEEVTQRVMMHGDVAPYCNHDGTLDVGDATVILEASEGLLTLPCTSGIYIGDGDLNGDNAVTAVDAEIALRKAVGLETITESDLVHGDVAPYCERDGTLDVGDATVILQTAEGQKELPCAQ